MQENPVVRLLLAPFALIYGAVVFFRNWLYDHEYLNSIEFDFPIISVGNLSYGGTGKTPHIEYLIKLLSGQFRVATLSRGYKRKTSGFLLASSNSEAEDIGDEPALLKKKYPHVEVCVGEQRSLAIPQLLSERPATDVVLLDDAFQHRTIQPGLSIVLTKYSNLFTRDYIMPVGTLREFRSAYKRADFIIVSKCPENLSREEKEKIVQEINPAKNQAVFFSYLKYHPAYNIANPADRITPNKEQDVLLFSGIASSDDLKDYLKPRVRNLYSRDFGDHHFFDRMDIENITDTFGNISSPNKIILTTEKDAVRLFAHKRWILEKKLPVYVLPVTVEFFEEDKKLFDSEITGYLSKLTELKTVSN